MAKHRERWIYDVEDSDLTRILGLRSNRRAMVLLISPFAKQQQSSSPHRRERARKSTLASLGTFVATRDLIALFQRLKGLNRIIGLDNEWEQSAQSGHSSRGCHALPGRR